MSTILRIFTSVALPQESALVARRLDEKSRNKPLRLYRDIPRIAVLLMNAFIIELK